MKTKSPLKAIRAKCLDCCAGQPKEVKLCPIEECPIYPYRFGKNPKRRGIGRGSGCFSQESPTHERISDGKGVS